MTKPAVGNCTGTTLAKVLDITERRVQQLAKEGIVVKSGRGEYQLAGSVHGYIKYLHRCLTQRTGEEEPSLQAERKRLLRLQGDKTAHELASLRGELVEVSVLNHLLQEAGHIFVSGLETLPSRLTRTLSGETDPGVIRSKTLYECRTVRRLTAKRLYALSDDFKEPAAVSAAGRCPEATQSE